MTRRVLTIDGLAGSGKSSIAKALAVKLDWVPFSSGGFYRALALLVKRAGITNYRNGEEISRLLNHHRIELLYKSGITELCIDDVAVDEEIYTPQISELTSIVSALPEVRQALLAPQREIMPGFDIVAEGRDMGSVVFPDAKLKFFLKVAPELRIERRIRQMVGDRELSIPEYKSLKEKMKIEITERDARDSSRALSPTAPAANAVIIDNSEETLTEVVKKMYDRAARVFKL